MKKLKISGVLQYSILIIWTLVNLFPLYWMFTFSLKENSEIFGENIIGLPKKWLWSNYATALTTGNMGRYFFNSIVVTGSTILLTTLFALMATYALTRLEWKGRKLVNNIFMLGLTVPIHAAILPVFSTIGIFTFLSAWNELMFAVIFISDSKYRTLPVGIQTLSGSYTTDWGPIGAALVIATLPTLIVYCFMSKKVQKSLIAGAVKG